MMRTAILAGAAAAAAAAGVEAANLGHLRKAKMGHGARKQLRQDGNDFSQGDVDFWLQLGTAAGSLISLDPETTTVPATRPNYIDISFDTILPDIQDLEITVPSALQSLMENYQLISQWETNFPKSALRKAIGQNKKNKKLAQGFDLGPIYDEGAITYEQGVKMNINVDVADEASNYRLARSGRAPHFVAKGKDNGGRRGDNGGPRGNDNGRGRGKDGATQCGGIDFELDVDVQILVVNPAEFDVVDECDNAGNNCNDGNRNRDNGNRNNDNGCNNGLRAAIWPSTETSFTIQVTDAEAGLNSVDIWETLYEDIGETFEKVFDSDYQAFFRITVRSPNRNVTLHSASITSYSATIEPSEVAVAIAALIILT